jgi:hypothetical protein
VNTPRVAHLFIHLALPCRLIPLVSRWRTLGVHHRALTPRDTSSVCAAGHLRMLSMTLTRLMTCRIYRALQFCTLCLTLCAAGHLRMLSRDRALWFTFALYRTLCAVSACVAGHVPMLADPMFAEMVPCLCDLLFFLMCVQRQATRACLLLLCSVRSCLLYLTMCAAHGCF